MQSTMTPTNARCVRILPNAHSAALNRRPEFPARQGTQRSRLTRSPPSIQSRPSSGRQNQSFSSSFDSPCKTPPRTAVKRCRPRSAGHWGMSAASWLRPARRNLHTQPCVCNTYPCDLVITQMVVYAQCATSLGNEKMSVTVELLDSLKAAQGGVSDYRAAKLLCVAQQTMSKYRNG